MYEPSINDATDLQSLKDYIDSEFRKISGAFLVGETDTLHCVVWYSLPPRPAEGLLAYLDNSIVGIATTGLHEYRGGAWVKL